MAKVALMDFDEALERVARVATEAAEHLEAVEAAGPDLQRLLANPEAAKVLAGAGAAFDTARFEERLAVLERTLSTTLNALGQLLKSAQQQATTSETGGPGK